MLLHNTFSYADCKHIVKLSSLNVCWQGVPIDYRYTWMKLRLLVMWRNGCSCILLTGAWVINW